MKKTILAIFSALLLTMLAACGGSDELETITFADAGWDSIKVHNYIAQTIIEEGYGFKTETTTGSTQATFQGLIEGDINVYTEVWTDNINPAYDEAIENEEIVKLSTNFADNVQGLYVPTYVIEGDEERGIEPMAPDLKTVEDLKKYPDVFEDPEDPDKGRILNGPSGWTVEEAISKKFETYGLDETMNNFIPGSDSALVADLVNHYEKGEPWVGYYWSPTWVTAKYDLTLLEEPEFDQDTWDETKGTAFPPNDVVVAVHKDFPEQAPDVTEFLKNYETSTELTETALKYMNENDMTAEEAGKWWMQEYEDVWTSWVSDDIAEKVKNALK
ncbi:ABC transporter substrate-binding protein [Lentibacillus saliphilus]|uniref:ABC transporter substrate-binding protein n=1 Tax=Lentibacillus saliphilus TaxID=2737028 RepID=UPI001FE832AE|nr:ABC transporter substrate-binding protein [Lentibacillus saliphilus]